MVFHALDSNILASFNTLSFQDLRKGTFSFFANQSVFYRHKDEKRKGDDGYCA